MRTPTQELSHHATTEDNKAPPAAHRDSDYGKGDDRSVVALYLGDIGKIPLITPLQEIELAAKIKAGDREARDLMIRSNLRLVVKIAHDYTNCGLPLADLISEGNLGLIKAVERFDPQKGGKLSTYASWWIKQRIKRALANQSKTIRLPVHLSERIAKIRKASTKLLEQLGRQPTDEEIAREVDIPVHKVAHLKSVSTRPTSLDAPVGEEENTKLGDLVGDENASTPVDDLMDKNLLEDVRESIRQLGPREAAVIRLRFGLDGNTPRTLEEIGKSFGITRERIRQLQNIALAQMRKKLFELERQSTSEDIEKERQIQERMEVLREFFETRIKETDLRPPAHFQ